MAIEETHRSYDDVVQELESEERFRGICSVSRLAVTPLCPPLPKLCQLAPRLALLALTPAPFRPDFHSLDWLISFTPIEPGADDDVHSLIQPSRLDVSSPR